MRWTWIIVALCAIGAAGCGKSAQTCSAPALGDCNGAVLDRCDPSTGELVSVDCSMQVASEPFTCGLVDDNVGNACLAPLGSPCEFFNTQQGEDDIFYCQGNGGACVLTAASSFCLQGITTCQLNDDGTVAGPACMSPDGGSGTAGTYLVVNCSPPQPVLYDCTQGGGSCLGTQCVGESEGTVCDPEDGGSVACGAGLHCLQFDGGAALCGTCTAMDGGSPLCQVCFPNDAGPAVDAGGLDGGARDGGPTDAGALDAGFTCYQT